MDLQGRKIATLGATVEDTPKFVLLDRGHERISMTTSKDGSAILSFRNTNLKAWSGLSLLPNGALNLDFFGPTRSLQLGVSAKGAADLAFSDARGNPIGGLGIRAEGPTDSLVVDRDGSILFPDRQKGQAEPRPIPLEILKPSALPAREIVAQRSGESVEVNSRGLVRVP
jgi:hypothetical protein